MSDESGEDKNSVEPCWPFWGCIESSEHQSHIDPERTYRFMSFAVGRSDTFGRLDSIGRQALKMLERRTLDEIRSAAVEIRAEIDAYIDNYIEDETESYINRLSTDGGWELGYLPPGSQGTEREIRDLLENWSGEWDDRPNLPSRDDVSDLDALMELSKHDRKELWHLALAEPEEHEFYAVLALMIICEVTHSQALMPRQAESIHGLKSLGYATINAVEAISFADRIQANHKIQMAITSAQPGLVEAELSKLMSERASNAARKRHSKNDAARNFVAAEWHRNSAEYDGNKTAFARDYVRRVENEFEITVTEKTMREVWLRDTLTARKQA